MLFRHLIYKLYVIFGHFPDVPVRARRAADHHEPRRHGVPDPSGPQQSHHHTAGRDHRASCEYAFINTNEVSFVTRTKLACVSHVTQQDLLHLILRY